MVLARQSRLKLSIPLRRIYQLSTLKSTRCGHQICIWVSNIRLMGSGLRILGLVVLSSKMTIELAKKTWSTHSTRNQSTLACGTSLKNSKILFLQLDWQKFWHKTTTGPTNVTLLALPLPQPVTDWFAQPWRKQPMESSLHLTVHSTESTTAKLLRSSFPGGATGKSIFYGEDAFRNPRGKRYQLVIGLKAGASATRCEYFTVK